MTNQPTNLSLGALLLHNVGEELEPVLDEHRLDVARQRRHPPSEHGPERLRGAAQVDRELAAYPGGRV